MPEGLASYFGNIDLDKRIPYINPETGQTQTEYSSSFQFGPENDPVEVLLPRIVNGKPVSNNEAIDHYRKTGEHLGRFSVSEWQRLNPDLDKNAFYKELNSYANKIHERQAKRYAK